MKLLEDRIRRDGHIGAGNVLKVDCFLNHQIDVPFISALGEEFYRLYKDAGITKILTIEASGIGIACLTAMHFGVPYCLPKKRRPTTSTAIFIQQKCILIHTSAPIPSMFPASSLRPTTGF